MKSKTDLKQDTSNHGSQGTYHYSTLNNQGIYCFKCQSRGQILNLCPNKKTIVIRNDGEIEIYDEHETELAL